MKTEKLALLLGWSKCGCGDEHCGAWFPPEVTSKNENAELLPSFEELLIRHIRENFSCDETIVSYGETGHDPKCRKCFLLNVLDFVKDNRIE